MKKCVNLYLSNDVDTEQRIKDIKAVGYDGLFVGVYDKNEFLTMEQQIEMAKKLNLTISMIHCSYVEPKLNDFWNEGEVGDWVENDIVEQIERIKDLGIKDFIIHTCGSKEAKNTNVGLERIKRIVKVCEKYDINLNIENLFLDSQVDYIFDNVKSKNIKFCFDCGHKNFLTKGVNYIDKYHDITTTLHLHDNFGEIDNHFILGEGNIDKDNLARELALLSDDVCLSAEIKFKKGDYSIDKLKQNLKELNALEERILAKRTNKASI